MMNHPSSAQPVPTARLGDYKNLAVVRQYRVVREFDVEHEILVQRRRAALLTPTDQPAARRDVACVSFEGFDAAGKPIPDSKMEDVTVTLGSGKLLPGAEDALLGHTAGQTVRLEFTYPENFRVAALSGTRAVFQMQLHSVSRWVLPAADDAFAQSKGYADLAAMRAAVRQILEAQHKKNADRSAANALLQQVAAGLDAQFPDGMLDGMAQDELKHLKSDLRGRRIAFQTYLDGMKITEQQLLARYRNEAEKRLRLQLAIECLADAEQLHPTEEELAAEMQRMQAARRSSDRPQPPVWPGAAQRAVIGRKVRAWLLANAAVTTQNILPESSRPLPVE